MLRLSKKADYALMAVKHLASQGGQTSASAREIAAQYAIPPELLAKILQRLVRKGLLASHQGIRGGYHLVRPATEMSVADVIQAIDGPVTLTVCSSGGDLCDQYSTCNVRDPLWHIKDRIVQMLGAYTIADMAADVRDGSEPQLVTVSGRSAAATAR